MKKYLTSVTFLVVFAGYAALQYLNSSSTAYSAPVAITTSTTPLPPTTTVASSQASPPPSENQSDGGSDDATEGTQQPTQSPPIQPPTQPTPTPVPVPTQKPQGQYIDGTYTGSPENAFYGMVQVQVTVSGGKIANVQFLQYPNDRSTSRFINQQATPILAQEAIQAQSANVNGVSGASDTSAAFVQSLASALVQAKA